MISKITVAADSDLVGRTVGELAAPRTSWVLALEQHGEDRLSPPDETVLAAGDVITLQTEPGGLKAVHALNQAAAT